MPVSTLGVNKVKRSASIQSEQSSLSDSRRVNFNPDVKIKRIPKQAVKPKAVVYVNPDDEFSGKFEDYSHEVPPTNQEEIATEAEAILRQLQEIQCSVSPTPLSGPNTLEKRKRGLGTSLTNLVTNGRLSKSSSDLVNDRNSLNKVQAMRVDGYSEQDDSSSPPPHDNRLHELQTLNLDGNINGKINNFQLNHHDSSGSTDYSPPPKKNNYTPPKPPRKAPSSSPPNIRRGYMSYDELEQPRRNGDLRHQSYDPKMENNVPFSYTGANNPTLNHLSKSPGRFSPSARLSPSRGNHTDSEILNSPTQVLYATISADKHRNHNLNNQHTVHSASQTNNSGFRPVPVEPQVKSRTSSRASSRENILDDGPSYRYNNGSSNGTSKHVTRSLERFVDEDKENLRQELRARIHVTSPDRYTPEKKINPRKPYKTTINTATDTIQYRGFSTENLHDKPHERKYMYNKSHHSGRQDTEHYKVPKNKAPVPADFRPRNGIRTDSDKDSSSAYNGHKSPHVYHQQYLEKKSNLRSPFASTRLVKNVESRNKQRGSPSREYDREGRRIQREHGSHERSRAYSGYSTSPDRETSPERYAKPRVSSKPNLTQRSPSSSPTRPPRTRGSPSREMQIPIRREHTGREVDRSPSTRAAATSKSPIKKIQQVHNDIRGDKKEQTMERAVSASPQRPIRTNTISRDRDGVRKVKTLLTYKSKIKPNDEDRLSKFTEYKGNQGNQATLERPEPVIITNGRRGSHSVGHDTLRRETHVDRERGQSVPPGANIDSMRDFYKSNQYKSMYTLPPSPSRPAPVLDRGSKTQTLERSTLQRERTNDERSTLQRERTKDQLTSRTKRLAKTSISEGELTDEQARQDRVNRQRNKFLNNMISRQGESTKPQVRRVVSSDREVETGKITRNGELNNRRTTSHEPRPRRQAPQPPPLQQVRRSSADVIDSSHSESEAPNADKEKAAGESGGRWASGQSDIDTDYRKELASSTTNINSVHMEARGRDGGGVPPSIYQQAATLGRNKSSGKMKVEREVRGRSASERSMREVEISQDDEEDEMMRSPTNMSREEERRKIIELEEDRRRKEVRLAGGQRTGSRASKVNGSKVKTSATKFAGPDTENESQYSGHSSSSLRKEPLAPKGRYAPNSNIRIKRTGSNATPTGGARHVINRKKMPGSLTSSINSSESEHGSQGSHAGQSGVSRGTNLSVSSNRSVYLHATAVADIPSAKDPRTIGESKENLNSGSNLQKSKKISRSISLLAPWKGKGNNKQQEVNYDNHQAIYGTAAAKPPRPPPQMRKPPGPNYTMTKEKKFASSSDLLRDENEIVMAPPEAQTMPRKPTAKVSRSVSMPKDTRIAGWFKKRKRV